MTDKLTDAEQTLMDLGWSAFYDDQLDAEEIPLARMRIATVHRSRMSAVSQSGPVKLTLPHQIKTTDFAVGDWVLVDPLTDMLVRRLERQSLLQRRSEDVRNRQLIAANVDTLFIITSCNDDFNPARLERYLALANEAGTTPVIVLTKTDKVTDAQTFHEQAACLQRGLDVVMLNAKSPEAVEALAPWCRPGQTVALIGSSGVGKSTLLNTLSDKAPDEQQQTGSIRQGDAKGRHTTTSRSLHAIAGGGWVIDTPGMRTLNVSDVAAGLDVLFAEITELAPDCRFRDCTHAHEPGCAVQNAVVAGVIDSARLSRWRKLVEENRERTTLETGPRGNKSSRRR